eukprot:1901068-Amphidinium_carterae.1
MERSGAPLSTMTSRFACEQVEAFGSRKVPQLCNGVGRLFTASTCPQTGTDMLGNRLPILFCSIGRACTMRLNLWVALVLQKTATIFLISVVLG